MRAARNLAAQVLTLTGARQFRALTVAPFVGIYPKLIKKMMTFFVIAVSLINLRESLS